MIIDELPRQCVQNRSASGDVLERISQQLPQPRAMVEIQGVGVGNSHCKSIVNHATELVRGEPVFKYERSKERERSLEVDVKFSLVQLENVPALWKIGPVLCVLVRNVEVTARRPSAERC